MNNVLVAAIQYVYNGLEFYKDDGFETVNEFVPIWDDLTPSEKCEAIEYLYNNQDDEDFGHSGCCKAIHQAAAFYCVKVLFQSKTDDHFDDIDFYMAASGRINAEVRENLGISEDF